jgi:polyisoprenoid-binding protein YceI
VRRLSITSLFTTLALAASACHAKELRIDSNRSHADFGVRLLWVHTIGGRFTDMHGLVNLDRQKLATVNVQIEINSVVMDSSRFRRWVLAPEFFDAQRHPVAHFLSDPVPFDRLASGGELDGRLNLRGVMHPIHLELLPASCATTAACVIEARGSVSRSDFGMISHGTSLSDQVKLDLMIALEPTPD